MAMVVMISNYLAILDTLIYSKPDSCLFDSSASHNFLFCGWCKINEFYFDTGELFSVHLADGQDVPAIKKI